MRTFAEYTVRFKVTSEYFNTQSEEVLDRLCENIDEVASPEIIQAFIIRKLNSKLGEYDLENVMVQVEE